MGRSMELKPQLNFCVTVLNHDLLFSENDVSCSKALQETARDLPILLTLTSFAL